VANSVPPLTGLSKYNIMALGREEMPRDSDLPSDTVLPAEQLQHEAEAAEGQANGHKTPQHTQDQIDATTIIYWR
jgi:hypothetical protein